MTKQMQLLIAASAGVLALGGLFVYFVYLPKRAESVALRTELAHERDRLREAEQKALEEATLDQRAAEVRRGLEYVYRRLPGVANLPEVISEISRAAARANVRYTVFDPQKAPAPTAGVVDLPIRVTVAGTYHGFGSFLTELFSQPRVFTITDVFMNAVASGGNTMEATAVVHAYHQQEPGT